MKPYVLFGIDKYHGKRLICIVSAATIEDAARKLGGAARDAGVVASGSPRQLYVDAGQECATFVPGDCTDEVLAQASAPAAGGSEAAHRLMAYYRYGTDHIYREYVLGTAPLVP